MLILVKMIYNPLLRWQRMLLAVWVGILAVLVTACAPAATLTPDDTPTIPLSTPTATPTIVWFPATATPTAFPTLTSLPPTPEMRPGIGEIILQDDFTSAEPWALADKDGATARLGKNELTITVSKKRVYQFSLRLEPQLTNFYLEITANPSLCRGLDEYGLLLRAASGNDYYRFSLSCDSQARLDRIYGGQASSPQPWMLSGAVPPGGPSTSRLGVWAVGDEMRFFANDEYLFTVEDGLLSTGTVGVFARSASDEALTVNFQDLTVWEVTP